MKAPGWVAVTVLACACAAWPAPGRAVDRSLGADVARPQTSGTAWNDAATRRLTHDIDALLDGAGALRAAHVGLLVVDARNSQVLYARNADDAFTPASTLKLLTGSVALANLSPAFRFRTQALFDPAATALYIRPGGDPLLNVADLDALAQTVRGAGVTGIAGGLHVDAGDFEFAPYPPGWSWDDLAYDYAAPVSAATVEENVIHLSLSAGARAGLPVTVRAMPPAFAAITAADCTGADAPDTLGVHVSATTSSPGTLDTSDISRLAGGCIEISGALPAGGVTQIDAAVTNPRWYMRELARFALTGAGVNAGPFLGLAAAGTLGADGNAPAGARVLWTHDGEPLSVLLADFWWPSDNLIGELLLRAIGRQAGGLPGTTEHGVAAERVWLRQIGVDPESLTIVDGSGLSSYDRLTPRALAAILQADWNGPFRDTVLDGLPLAGVRGTLAHSFPGTLAERRTFAKTGSMNHTRSLAGYLATLHHGALTFAWTVDDWMGNDVELDALRARVLTRLIGD